MYVKFANGFELLVPPPPAQSFVGKFPLASVRFRFAKLGVYAKL